MTALPEIRTDEHVFMLRDKDGGEEFEVTVHDDGGITFATAYRQPDFCNVTQASLTREQVDQMLSWLSRSLAAPTA